MMISAIQLASGLIETVHKRTSLLDVKKETFSGNQLDSQCLTDSGLVNPVNPVNLQEAARASGASKQRSPLSYENQSFPTQTRIQIRDARVSR